MLKIESDRGNVSVLCNGPTHEVVADLGVAIANIYHQLKKTPTSAAKEFRSSILCMLGADSPIWEFTPLVEDPNGVAVVIPVKKKEDLT